MAEEKPLRKHLNAAEKRALKAADIRRFVQVYGQRKPRGSYEPNDRGYDREIEEIVRRMSPAMACGLEQRLWDMRYREAN